MCPFTVIQVLAYSSLNIRHRVRTMLDVIVDNTAHVMVDVIIDMIYVIVEIVADAILFYYTILVL